MKNFLLEFNKIDNAIFRVMKNGVIFSFFVCIISIFALEIFNIYYISYNLYEISISLFKTGIILLVSFISCGVVVDTIKKAFD